jgi:FixJ family two-component response regulator
MNANGPLICVIDDESLVRESLRRVLRSAGLKVQTFSSAHEFLTNRPSEGPSCLVLDVQMPGTSGLELQRELSRSGSPVPIIFITGHGDIPMSVRAMKAGAFEFLTKPCRDEDLLNVVKQAIERRSPIDLPRNGSDPTSFERMDVNRPESEILTEPEIRHRERENLFAVLQKAGWKIKGADGAAELLGINPQR